MRRSGDDVHGRRRGRLATGTTLMVLAVAMSTLGLAPAAAQAPEDPEDPEAEPAADTGEPIEITGSAVFVSPVTDAVPPTLTSSVPPAAVCVLQPDLCPGKPEELPEEVRDALPWREDISAGIEGLLDQGRDLPVQPLLPETAAVSYLGGVTRYQTALMFDTPPVPEGEDVMRFELTFAQAEPTYDISSPAFRRAVLAAFETIQTQDPAVFAEGLAAALSEEDVIDTSKVLAFEACPLLDAVEPAGAPMASDDTELPHHDDDGEDVVAVDCTYGGNGVFDEDAEVWRVDLAFTAQAWADGELENHGVLLRPIGAPNLAFGDADTTTNAQLVLDIAEVTAEIETMEAFDPGDFDVPAAEPAFAEDDTFAAGGDDLDGGFSDDIGGAAGGDDLGAPLDAPSFPEEGDEAFAADAPEVADDLVAAPEAELNAQAARPAGAVPTTPWWVWLAAPLLLGGAYLTGSSVLAPAPVVAGAGGGGALTRLLAKQGAANTAPTQI